MSMFPRALACLIACSAAFAAPEALSREQRLADFDAMVAFVKTRYAWPERIDLPALVAAYRPQASEAPTRAVFHRVLEDFLDGLGDAHCHLGSNSATSWCLPPGQVAAAWQGDKAVLTGVWPGSGAEKAGFRPGMEVLAWNGQPLSQALKARSQHLPAVLHEEQAHWRLNALLAGTHSQGCRLTVRDAQGSRDLDLPAGFPPEQPVGETRLLKGDIGLLAFRELGDDANVARLDEALARYPQAKGWILDLRGLRSGGSTSVTVPMMGRFVPKTGIYAWMQRRSGAGLGRPWPERVTPRGKVFTGPVVVLVDPWTASAGEGLAMGLAGLGRATVVGTRMAGLGAAVHSLTLRHSGLRVQISTEPVLDAQKRPRSAFRPQVEVDPSVEGDPILEAGVRVVGGL